jgi:internalin A
MPALSNLGMLRTLSLENQMVGDAGLGVLRQLGGLAALDLAGTKVSDEAFPTLARLRGLTRLRLSGTYERITGRLVALLVGRCPLRHLIAYDTNWTDAAARELAGFPELEVLDLSETHVSDAGLQGLGGLVRLRSLALELQALVTDAGLRHLWGLRNLRCLSLAHTGVGPAPLDRLSLGHLTHLDLRSTQVTDAGLAPLRQSRGLLHLDLSSTLVTPSSIDVLASCRKLRRLDLQGTAYDSLALATLRVRLPQCSISPVAAS